MIPKTWVKFVVGLFLLFPAWVVTKTFFNTLATALHHGLLVTPGALFFVAGIVLWILLFWLLPRSWFFFLYVYGHECTHALWAKLFRARVAEKFHVSQEGGHILTDRVNTWITLSPYFFPIYTVLVISIYFLARLFGPIGSLELLFALLLGLTWAFHLTFTCILIVKGQPDLKYGGTFFSLLLIYLINLLIMTLPLLLHHPEMMLPNYWENLSSNSVEALLFVSLMLQQIELLVMRLIKRAIGIV
jgi:hypothetical protein